VLAGAALALPLVASDFVVSLALDCLMYAALASSWSLSAAARATSRSRPSAFFGIGAYTSALPGAAALARAIGLGAASPPLVAVVMGAAVLHLRGTYFAC
jgi:branched-chain amino acid transport system permease protein